MQRYVAGLAFSDDGTRVALVRKNRPAWQAGFLNAIGGKIEPGELPLDAMVREFAEEAGLLTGPGDWAHVVTLAGQDFEVYFYKAFLHELDYVAAGTDEAIEIHASLPVRADVVAGLQWQIPLALDNVVSTQTILDHGSTRPRPRRSPEENPRASGPAAAGNPSSVKVSNRGRVPASLRRAFASRHPYGQTAGISAAAASPSPRPPGANHLWRLTR